MYDLREVRKVYTFTVGPKVFRIASESKLDAMSRMNDRLHKAGLMPPDFYGWNEGRDGYNFSALLGAWD